MSKIEWTGRTWNPVTGCTKVSPGCKHCYAEIMALRLQRMAQTGQANGYESGFAVTLHPQRLLDPEKWRKPSTIFVCSMADLFHQSVPFEYIAAVFGAMAQSRQHTFQILTKRPERMLAFYGWLSNQTFLYEWWQRSINLSEWQFGEEIGSRGRKNELPQALVISAFYDRAMIAQGKGSHGSYWPLDNVWIGVSVEDRKYGIPRIAELRKVDAKTRFLSIEPLLEDLGELDLCGIHWVIVGGESGQHARPMNPAWVRSIRDQCQAAGVPFFFKQWGGTNKKATGRTLDGRTWDELPEVKP